MALKGKANHYRLLDSKFKLSQLSVKVWQSEDKHHIPLKVSNLQFVELRRKINVSKEERCLEFI